jgi:hypothetical protein
MAGARVLRHNLPLTKGLQIVLLESEDGRVSPKRPSRRAVERAEALLDLTL